MWKQLNTKEWIYGDVGRIIRRNAKYYAFYRELILSGYDTLEEAMKMVENPTAQYDSLLTPNYPTRP